MDALPTAPSYTPHTQNSQNQYTARQSPTRPGSYGSPNSYYASRRLHGQQLPSITPYSSTNNQEQYPQSATTQLNAVFGNEMNAPRRQLPQAAPTAIGRGPVPEFTRIRSVSELQPKINAQPAFRRAHPEGGFISVSLSSCNCRPECMY
jgi:dual specificity protein kinase YAK1